MATTTNFGWETPDDTDLVKDGALAIRTLGSAIDTSLVDLKGGTTGQVLSKTSNTDMDFTWVTSDDANAIQNAIVDAKGDLITATAADTPARLAVGADGYVLTADSTQSTGIKWAAASSGATLVGCSLYSSTFPSISNSTYTILDWDSEIFDSDSYHSTSTNPSRVTIPTGKGGKYNVSVTIPWDWFSAGYRRFTIKKNGSTNVWFQHDSSLPNNTTSTQAQHWSGVLNVAAGDYLQIEVYQTSGSSRGITAGEAWVRWDMIYLGA